MCGLYECETWKIRRYERSRLKVVKRLWCYRTLLKNEWKDQARNRKVKLRIGNSEIESFNLRIR